MIGHSPEAYWARLARVRIVAEIPEWGVENFWAADPDIKQRVLETFARTGAKVIIAERVPASPSTSAWQRIAQTDYYVRLSSR